MIKEIDLVEILCSIKADFVIDDLSNGTQRITLTKPGSVLCFQGWKQITVIDNALKRKNFRISVGMLMMAIKNYNKNNPNNLFTPSVVVKKYQDSNTYVMSIKSFHLKKNSLGKEEFSFIVTNNFKNKNTGSYLQNNSLSSGEKGTFVLQGLNYGELNFNNQLDNINTGFSEADKKEKLMVMKPMVYAKRNLRKFASTNYNFLYESSFDVTVNENGNLLFTHEVTESTSHIFPFQGWERETGLANNFHYRDIEGFPVSKFVDDFKVLTNFLTNNYENMNEYSVESCLDKYSFQPTCYFNYSDDVSNEYHLGVIKNFDYTLFR